VTGSYVDKMVRSGNPVPLNKQADKQSSLQYLVNHFLDVNITFLGEDIPIPATSELTQTNAATGPTSLGKQANSCFANWGYWPTFTLVDFYDVGNGSVFGVYLSLLICPRLRKALNASSPLSLDRVHGDSKRCHLRTRDDRQRLVNDHLDDFRERIRHFDSFVR
jgi:hypothetical protein